MSVVLLLLGIILTLAVPRVRDAFLTDELKTTTRKMVGILKTLRNEAIREHMDYIIYFDLEQNRYWTESRSMNEQERIEAREKAASIPEGVRLMDVWVMGEGKKASGEVLVHVSRKGYVQPTVIHLSSTDGREFTVKVSPLIGKVAVFEEYIDFEEAG